MATALVVMAEMRCCSCCFYCLFVDMEVMLGICMSNLSSDETRSEESLFLAWLL